MTVPSTSSEIPYATDGVSVNFPIPFPFDTSADIVAKLTDSSGNIAPFTAYSISGGAGSTGTLTTNSVLASGSTLTIYDDPEKSQETDYVDNDPFPASSHEGALDKLTRLIKRLSKRLDRTLRTADGDPITDLTLGSVDNRKGKYLFFNAVTGAIEYAVALVTTALSQSIIGQLLFPQSPEESATSITPASYAVDVTDYTNVMRYVTNTIDGVNSQAVAFQKAVDIAKFSGRTITVPSPPNGAAYVLDAPLNCAITVADTASGANSRGFTFRGEGNQLGVTASATVRPIILAKHTGHVFDCTGSYGINFENLSIGTDASTYPKTCFFWARNASGSGSIHRATKCRVFGKFSESILYNYGAEEDILDGCQFSNREGGANARVLTYSAYNHRALTSSFVTIAAGQQSTIAHSIYGGTFHNFSHNAAADVLYVDAISLLRVKDGHWTCADNTGGGRSLVYISTANGPTNELMLHGFGGEVSTPNLPTYGVYIGDAVAICSGLIFDGCRLPNATDAIRSHANVELQTSRFKNVSSAGTGGGINILGTLTDSDHFAQAGSFAVGTYKQNNIIARNGEASMTIADLSAASGKKYFRHRSVGGQYVVALYADDGVTNLGNAIVVTTSTGLTVTNISLAAGTYSLLVASLGNFANDAAAAAGGVPVGNLYRNGSVVQIRVA